MPTAAGAPVDDGRKGESGGLWHPDLVPVGGFGGTMPAVVEIFPGNCAFLENGCKLPRDSHHTHLGGGSIYGQ
jgi:hypothetical protein